jgi:hypothetical protein
MENNSFKSSIIVPAGAAEVMGKISRVPEWWGISFTGKAGKKGEEFLVKMGEEAFFNMTVTEFLPGKRMVWQVGDCYMPWYTDKTEWSDTRLIFELDEKDGKTTVTFTHDGLTPQRECYKDCDPGWTHWIKTSLFSYLTTGKGVFRAPTK